MRKALIGFILAATVMTPIAAEAQRHHDNDGGSHSRGDGGSHSRGSNGNGEARAARIEARNEARSQSSQPQQAQQSRAQVAQSPRGDGNRGGWNRGNGDGNRGNRGGGDGNRHTRGTQPSIYPQAWQGNPNDPRLQHYRELERRNQNSGYDRNRRGGDRDGRNWRNDRNDRHGRHNWRNDWNRGWRNDNRYNWSSWRNQNRNRYHLSRYYSPYRNWSYRRFSVGLFLDSLFYNQRYWIGDPWQYRLPPAPYGTQWVRYYNDVLLVDVYTGEVVDVIYDFFW
jgi:hypothetical protein